MKKIKILYWVFTGIFAAFMTFSGIPDIMSIPEAVTMFKQMSLPAYLLPFLGTAKVLGALAIVLPVNHKIKEWAYAGLVFDLIGAAYCQAAAGFPVSSWAFMILPLGFAAVSYGLYHKKLSISSSRDTSANENRIITSGVMS